MAVDGLAWLPFQVNLWRGRFGSTPSYFGAMDTDLKNHGAGRTTLGDEDADVEITAAGTLLLADLDLIVNKNFNSFQLGVNVTRCPAGTTGPSGCTHIFLDTAGADREWITSSGQNVWVAYHDSQSSTIIRVKRSTDDGMTWTAAGSPIPGQGTATGDATFNNSIGPIVGDPSTGVVYESYAAGEPQTKGSSANYNNTVDGTILAQGAPIRRNFANQEYEWYVQDTWHVSRAVTISLGVSGYPEFGVNLLPIVFAAYAKACGAAGYCIEDPAQCEEVLREAFAQPGPAVIEAVVDANEPPLPGRIKTQEAVRFAQALLKGQPDKNTITQSK